MGHYYRSQFSVVAIGTGVAASTGFWEIHQTNPLTSLPLFIWQVQFTMSVGAALAGNYALRLQREATLVHTGGTAGVIAPVSAAAPATGATVSIGAATGLTLGTPTGTGKLAAWGMSTAVLGSSSHVLGPLGERSENWEPLAVVKGTEQLVLCLDAVTVAMVGGLHGSVYWSEGP